MAEIVFTEIVQAARKLTPEQKSALIHTLQREAMPDYVPLTRERALAELEARRAAGAFVNVESLYGKYGRADLDISDEALNAYLREVGKEWEEELDDLIDGD